MDELEAAGKVALANTFLMYFKAHANHWNVEGKNFAQYHSFLGDLYDDLFGAVDPIAEELRACGYYAPISLTELYTYATIKEDEVKPKYSQQIFANLLEANTQVVDSLNKLFQVASANNKQGFANFVADRLDKHSKHGWMLRAFLAGE